MNGKSAIRSHWGDYRWDGVDLHAYKDEGSAPFRDITRQTLFRDHQLAGELRYFEIAPGGHSTLERHEHLHAVIVLRGSGRCLLGEEVRKIGSLDLVAIPAMTWHQFRADQGEPLGFLCMVDAMRDKPQLPDQAAFAALCANPAVADFLRPADSR
jgi:quercetin dioxygenase-like cupin family protein